MRGGSTKILEWMAVDLGEGSPGPEFDATPLSTTVSGSPSMLSTVSNPAAAVGSCFQWKIYLLSTKQQTEVVSIQLVDIVEVLADITKIKEIIVDFFNAFSTTDDSIYLHCVRVAIVVSVELSKSHQLAALMPWLLKEVFVLTCSFVFH